MFGNFYRDKNKWGYCIWFKWWYLDKYKLSNYRRTWNLKFHKTQPELAGSFFQQLGRSPNTIFRPSNFLCLFETVSLNIHFYKKNPYNRKYVVTILVFYLYKHNQCADVIQISELCCAHLLHWLSTNYVIFGKKI